MTLRCDGDSPITWLLVARCFMATRVKPLMKNQITRAMSSGSKPWWRTKFMTCSMANNADSLVAKVPKGPPSASEARGGSGIPVTELSSDQKNMSRKCLANFWRCIIVDQNEVQKSLSAQGDWMHAVLRSTPIGILVGIKWTTGVLKVRHLSGISGFSHVHVWVNVASSADVETNAAG